MPMYKAADLVEDLVVSLPVEETGSDEVVFYEEMPTDEEVVEMHSPAADLEISFKLPYLPGCTDPVVEVSGDELEVGSKEEEKEKEKDKSKAADQPKDLNWVKDYLDNIPKHKGETIGLERAKSYLARGNNLLSKLLQDDFDGKIDIAKAEEARIEIENGVDRLEKELYKRKKKADKSSVELKKEGQKVAAVGGIIVTVPILISRIARVCINGSISGGKDIEDLFHRQSKKWNLTEREKAEVVQLIQDMGYPVPRLDRGFQVDDKEPYERSSTDNYDYPANYNA
jgi:hypothetical protein